MKPTDGAVCAACMLIGGIACTTSIESTVRPEQICPEGESANRSTTNTDEYLVEPVVRAQPIQIETGSTVQAVSGTTYIVRNDVGSISASVGAVLRDGDLVDLAGECSRIAIRSGDRTIELRRENGRFFRLVLPAP